MPYTEPPPDGNETPCVLMLAGGARVDFEERRFNDDREERMIKVKKPLLASAVLAALCAAVVWAQGPGRGDEKPWEKRKREKQDRAGGVPEKILKRQSDEKVVPPSIDDAVKIALEAARSAALPLIDAKFHTGKRLAVPGGFRTIQSAIDAAKAGDIVVVHPGVYFELLVMKDGVKLVSDASDGGNTLVEVEGARLKLPKRALRTILDGSRSKPSHHGMIDFGAGVGRKTIVDGFTIRNLPEQDHHIPGHAHGLNVRGASPVIMNCFLLGNGSTGIGNHVVYRDQKTAIKNRDFRWANIEHRAEAVIYNNIIRGSLGLGIGCNHFSAPQILGNEVFGNSEEPGNTPTPGMGAKHGAAPTIIGNIVHDNPGGGILSRKGDPQGAHPIDRPTHPTVMRNVVYGNGKVRAGIACNGGGSTRTPVRFIGNFVYDAGLAGVGLSGGAVGIIEDNVVSGSGVSGIAVHKATALKLNRNRVTGAKGPGFVIAGGAIVREMVGNAANGNAGPRFLLHEGNIAD
ncbi:MAG: right-handed parallel beta-helix repeat-containing protein [Planctomycetota bacterium]